MWTAGLGLARKWRSREKIKRPIIHSFVANSRFDKIHIFSMLEERKRNFPFFTSLLFLLISPFFPILSHIIHISKSFPHYFLHVSSLATFVANVAERQISRYENDSDQLVSASHNYQPCICICICICILDHVQNKSIVGQLGGGSAFSMCVIHMYRVWTGLNICKELL